jgi:hypothetical protein
MKAFKRFWNWMFPTHTHCEGCGEKLPQPSPVGVCLSCNVW